MWRRALLAVAALSYLICVLIMSGMQKEDLDVSMLAKLQRYNVNLDDIDNEQIRRQCASTSNGFTSDGREEIKQDYVTTTEYKSTIVTESPLPFVSMSIDTVMNYLKVHGNSIKDFDSMTTEKILTTEPEKITQTPKHVEDEPKIDVDLLRRYFQLEKHKKSSYKIEDVSERADRGETNKIITNERSSIVGDDVTTIDKLIKDYLSKKEITSPTTEHTTTKFTVDIENIYKRFDEMIANRSNIHNNENNKTTSNYSDKNNQRNTEYNFDIPIQLTPINPKTIYPSGKLLFESFHKFFSDMNQFRNYSFRSFSTENGTKNVNVVTSTEKLSENISNNQNDQENYKESTTHKTESDKKVDQSNLTPNLVKEIAETVKDVLIKDLRNELADIYSKTTQTTPTTVETTTETFPTTSINRIQEKDMVILEKFMDLYKEIKSLKEVNYLLSVHNESDIFVNNFKQPYNSPMKSPIFMPLPSRLLSAEPKNIISPARNYNRNQPFNPNSLLPRQRTNHLSPITIQTNSVEIQPLAVPVSRSESLINQNIVVQTSNHNRNRNRQTFGPFIPRARYSDFDQPTKQTNRTYASSPSKRYDGYNSARYPIYNSLETKQVNDVIRFRLRDSGNSKVDTDYYEKINFGNSNVSEKRGFFKHRDVPRFHNRLERIETGSNGTPFDSDSDAAAKRHESGADVPSRYQLSLVDAKKVAPYDDTHFKNFLKTQQKVTDVLEKILATRSKVNTPRSVEAV